MNILVVDDDRMFRLVLERLGGYTIVTVEWGEDAIDAALRDRPDTMLLDVSLPGMGGPEVLERLRADPSSTELPIALMTGIEDAHEVGHVQSLAAQDLIIKPVDTPTLVERVRALTRPTRQTEVYRPSRRTGPS